MKAFEIEIGYHYLTVFMTDRRDVLLAGREMYAYINRRWKGIAPLQQKDLAHEPNDPNVYHPWGQPDELGKDYPFHFHVRLGKEPTDSDLEKLKEALMFIKVDIKDANVTSIRQYEEGRTYPSIEGDYFEWIVQMRTGEWKRGK